MKDTKLNKHHNSLAVDNGFNHQCYANTSSFNIFGGTDKCKKETTTVSPSLFDLEYERAGKSVSES